MRPDEHTASPHVPRHGRRPPTRLHVLPLGEICCRYEVVAPGVADGRRRHVPVPAFLIERDDGFVLVDTGMHRVHLDDPDATYRGTPAEDELSAAMRPEDLLLRRLAERGVDVRDIAHVINTHLHFDHAGNNDLLGHATFHVQREHYAFARTSPSCPDRYWNLPSLRYELVDGDAELFAGISVLATPGHLPGHQSVVLDLPDTGTVVLTGDAVHCAENVVTDDWSHQADPELARASALRLRELATERDAMLVYGHDREQMAELFDGGARVYT